MSSRVTVSFKRSAFSRQIFAGLALCAFFLSGCKTNSESVANSQQNPAGSDRASSPASSSDSRDAPRRPRRGRRGHTGSARRLRFLPCSIFPGLRNFAPPTTAVRNADMASASLCTASGRRITATIPKTAATLPAHPILNPSLTSFPQPASWSTSGKLTAPARPRCRCLLRADQKGVHFPSKSPPESDQEPTRMVLLHLICCSVLRKRIPAIRQEASRSVAVIIA